MMKAKTKQITKSVFSISIILAILGGGVIFCIFMIALIIGGVLGELLAINASKVIMPYFIRVASIAVLFGLISFYITGKHTLSLEEKE